MVRKFLYLVAGLIIVAIVGAFVLNIWSKELTEIAFVPSQEFVEQDPLEENAYQAPGMWFSRPGIGVNDPARWQPATRGADRTVPPTRITGKQFRRLLRSSDKLPPAHQLERAAR